MTDKIVVFWFRRDLRLDDNTALYHALSSGYPVLPVFIFDMNILSRLPERYDRRVDFIHQCLTHLQVQLQETGSGLRVFHSDPETAFVELTDQFNIAAVYTNHDYEPEAVGRDARIGQRLLSRGIPMFTYKDQVVFEKSEVVKDDSQPYTVFTPYSKKWKQQLESGHLRSWQSGSMRDNFVKMSQPPLPSLESLGFKPTEIRFSPPVLNTDIARDYAATRDFPATEGTTRLSIHLRFGTLGIRKLVSEVRNLNETLLNELIWREFYMMILWHFPHVAGRAFKKQYDQIEWRNREDEFESWTSGRTGYPIVDAGMRELNQTGYMHNRVRMIAASFLTKHLLIDWRWGEQYFAARLNDFDLSANNGGWQWAAGSGCDAAPYFRIFNPALQTAKFDPHLAYVRRWVPEFEQLGYPQPIVDHEMARKRCIATYKKYLYNEI